MNTGSNNTSSAASPATRAQSISRWACVLVSGVAVGITLTVFQVVHLKVSPNEQLIASMQHDDGQLMQERKVSDPLPRGLILDRAGRTLAIDSIGGLLYVDVRDLYRDTELRNERLAKLMANGKVVVENGRTYSIEQKLVDGKKVAERKQIPDMVTNPIMALAYELSPVLGKPASEIADDIIYRPAEEAGQPRPSRIAPELRRLPDSGELSAEDLAQLPRWVVLAKDMDDKQIGLLKQAKEAGGPSSSLRGAHLLPKGERERPYGVTGAALVGLTGRDTLLADLEVDVQELYRSTAEYNAYSGEEGIRRAAANVGLSREFIDDPIVEFAIDLTDIMRPGRPHKPDASVKELTAAFKDLSSKNKAKRTAAEAKVQAAMEKYDAAEATWQAKAAPLRNDIIARLHAVVPMELRTLPTDGSFTDADFARLPKSVVVLSDMVRGDIQRVRAAQALANTPDPNDNGNRDQSFKAVVAANVSSKQEGVIGLSGFERIAGDPSGGPLNSADGYTTFVSAMNGAVISITPDGYKPGEAGKPVRLSIDISIQEMVERRVNHTVFSAADSKAATANAQGGRCVVVDVETGEILAAYSVLNTKTGRTPITSDFALEQKGLSDEERAALGRMRWATDPFEPGSIFKPFVWGWAIDHGFARRSETISLPAGPVTFTDGRAKRTIKEAHATSFGTKTWEQVLVKSVNTGMATIAMRMGCDEMRHCLDRWGFGHSTHAFGQLANPALDGEATGLMPPAREWDNKTKALLSTSFGQGISVTPLQLVHAFTAFCRNGDMVPLTLQPVASDSLSGSTPVLSANAVQETREVMELVIKEGTGKRLMDVLKYRAFGKSGTAQLAQPPSKEHPRGFYPADQHLSSFVIGAPFDHPKIAVLVTIEQPDEKHLGDSYGGGAMAGPCAAYIVNDVLEYLGVPTEKPEAGQLAYKDAELQDWKDAGAPAPTKVAAKPAAKKSQPAAKPQAKQKLASAAR